MKRFRPLLLLVAAIVSAASASFAAQPAARNPSRERKIEEALAAASSALVPTFRRATEALDSGKYAEAEPLYKEVLASAPNFTPAMRRLGGVLVQLGRRADGLALMNQAVQIDRSPENLISLAGALGYGPNGITTSTADLKAAFGLAKEAAQANRDPEDDAYDAMVAQLALGLQDKTSFRLAVDALNTKHPRAASTHYFAAVAAAIDGRWEQAETRFAKRSVSGSRTKPPKHSSLQACIRGRMCGDTRAIPGICSSRGRRACCSCSSPDGFSPAGRCHRSSERIRMFSRRIRNDRSGGLIAL